MHRVKNKRELNASLKGATLGDVDADTDDTLKWIKRAKKKEKELAKKRQQELEDRDKQLQGDNYSESKELLNFIGLGTYWRFAEDLEGLKVAHDFEELGEGEERILTLKDSRILDNEGQLTHNKTLIVSLSYDLQRTSFRTWRWLKTRRRRRGMN